MRLTTREEYSILTLLEMAQSYKDDSVSLKSISKSNNISQSYLAQIFMSLKNSGLVSAYSGSRGGYRLAKSPGKITLYDIIRAVSGDLRLSNCLDDPEYCNRANQCNFRMALTDINSKMIELLKVYTLEKIINIDPALMGKPARN